MFSWHLTTVDVCRLERASAQYNKINTSCSHLCDIYNIYNNINMHFWIPQFPLHWNVIEHFFLNAADCKGGVNSTFFSSSSNNSPVSLASASNRSDKRVLAKHCQCFDHVALGLGKKAWVEQGVILWFTTWIQHLGLGSAIRAAQPARALSSRVQVTSRSHSLTWQKSVGGTGMLARAGAMTDLIVSRLCLKEWDHMSQANYTLFI